MKIKMSKIINEFDESILIKRLIFFNSNIIRILVQLND